MSQNNRYVTSLFIVIFASIFHLNGYPCDVSDSKSISPKAALKRKWEKKEKNIRGKGEKKLGQAAKRKSRIER